MLGLDNVFQDKGCSKPFEHCSIPSAYSLEFIHRRTFSGRKASQHLPTARSSRIKPLPVLAQPSANLPPLDTLLQPSSPALSALSLHKMFAKLALYTLAASGLALAAPAPQLQNGPYGQCNTGQIQCCQQVVPASDLNPAVLNGLLGVVIQDVNVVVGLQCTSVNVIGIESGNTW